MLLALPLETPEDHQLAEQTARYVERHQLTPEGTALLTASSILLPVRTADGTAAIIKTVRANHHELRAPILLHHYNGYGAVQLLDHDTNLMLIERAISNHEPLWHMAAVSGRDEEATVIICDVSKKLFSAPWNETVSLALPDYVEFKCEPLLKRIEQKLVPKQLTKSFEIAAELQAELSAAYPHVPLHSDMHHWNIVHDHKRGWLSIDPQGQMGPAPAALANTVTNPYDPAYGLQPEFVLNRIRMNDRVAQISEIMGWNRNDLSKFVFCHAAQIASKRLDGTPRSQVGLSYWEKALTISADVAGINLAKPVVFGS